MKKYKMLSESMLQDQVTKACIPMADGNRHYEEYKAWLAQGNTPDPADPPVVLGDNGQSEVALKAEIKQNIERGEFADAITKMAQLLKVE